MLKISEVYEKQVKYPKEKPDGSPFIDFQRVYDSRECLINLEYVISVSSFEFSSSIDKERAAKSFPQNTKFSKFILDGNSFRKSEIVVLGSFDKFCRILQDSNK